eukprot:c11950_g1_i1 orf=420-1043(+)
MQCASETSSISCDQKMATCTNSMDSKATEHIRPALRRRLAKDCTSARADDTREQDTASVASASQSPGLSGLDASESPSLVGLSRSVITAGALKDCNRNDLTQENLLSGVSKSGRVVHKSDPLGKEVFPLSRRARRFRRGESSSQKHMEDVKAQAKNAALLLAQQAVATGNFKSLDSQFNNLLIPVIPTQFFCEGLNSIDMDRHFSHN